MTDHTSAEALRDTWEYDWTPAPVERDLVERGKAGWELCGVTKYPYSNSTSMFYFKRRVAALSHSQAQGLTTNPAAVGRIVAVARHMLAEQKYIPSRQCNPGYIGWGNLMRDAVDALDAVSLPCTQGLTITNEMVERALYAQLCVFRTGYRLKQISFEEMKTFEKLQERWDDGVKAMRAALQAALNPDAEEPPLPKPNNSNPIIGAVDAAEVYSSEEAEEHIAENRL